jgi:hypothetical protein
MAHGVALVAGLLLFVFGGVAALVLRAGTRGHARLFHGRQVLARWQVDGQTWDDFVTADRHLHAMKGHRLNRLHVMRNRPPGPAEIVVGKGSVEVDGDFHSFDTPGMPTIEYVTRSPQYPHYLELGFHFSGGSFPRDSCLRFPFPASRQGAATRVQSYYETFEASRARPDRR